MYYRTLNHSGVQVSAAYNLNPHVTLAAQVNHTLANAAADAGLAVGGRVQCGSTLNFQGSCDRNGNVAARMEQQLYPWAKLTVVGSSTLFSYATPSFLFVCVC